MELKNMARNYENKQLRAQNDRLEKLIKEYIQARTVTDQTLQARYSNSLLTLRGPAYVVVDRW